MAYPFNVLTVDASDPDAQYSSIQAAIDAASVDTLIHVGPGHYNETLTLKNGIRIVGHGSPDGNAPSTRIHKITVGQNSVLVTTSGSGVATLENLHLGLDFNSGGNSLLSGTLINVPGDTNSMYLNLRNCNLYLNEFDPEPYGGKLRLLKVTGSFFYNDGNVTLENCLLTLNTVWSTDAHDVFLDRGSVTLRNSRSTSIPSVFSVTDRGELILNNSEVGKVKLSGSLAKLTITSGRLISLDNFNGNVLGNYWYETVNKSLKVKKAESVYNVLTDDIRQVYATNTTTTSSTFYTLLPNMSLVVPESGNYLVSFSTTTDSNSNNAYVDFSIFVNNVEISYSKRSFRRGGNSGAISGVVCIHTYISADSGQSIEIRWKTSSGTASAYERNLLVQKA